MLSPYVYEFSKGNGTGVAEAIGNWGFSHYTSSVNDGGIARAKCLLNEMDRLKIFKPTLTIVYDGRNDPGIIWPVCSSLRECKPYWKFPDKRPLITFNSTADTIPMSSFSSVKKEMESPIAGRHYLWDKSVEKLFIVQSICRIIQL